MLGPHQKGKEEKGGERSPSPLPSSGRISTANGKKAERQLLDDYTLGKELGQGAYGVVYACVRRGHKDDVRAVKMIDKAESPVSEIKKEALILERISHPNVIKFHEVYYEKCFVCIVMDRYKGGDLIVGMQHHWETKGRIPCTEVKHIKRQCAMAIEHLHFKGVIHRDVKGDNYLLDRIDIRDPNCKVVLTDFGTAMNCKIAEHCRGSVGTKTYWSPEFYNNDYGQKVDVWAFGVIVYGLLEGRFPFKDEEAVRIRKPKLHPDLPAPCVDFTRALLKKEEARRASAAECVNHPWIEGATSAEAEAPAEDDERATPTNAHAHEKESEKDKKFRAENQPNAVHKERRYELVARLEQAERQRQSVGSTAQASGHHFMNDSFQIYYRHELKTVTFAWMDEETVESKVLSKSIGEEVQGEAMYSEITSDASALFDNAAIEATLKDHGVDISLWGTGEAKTMDHFLQEVHAGASSLMLDASKYKRMVRVVDVVLVRLTHRNESGENMYLIEVNDVLKDGRARNNLNRMPGAKKDPHENLKKCTARVCKDSMGIEESYLKINFKTKEISEESFESKSFPGVETVYTKTIVEAEFASADVETLKRFGFDGKSYTYSFTEPDGTVKHLKWATEAECAAMTPAPKLRAAQASETVSGLTHAPILITEEALRNYLTKNGIDVEKFATPDSEIGTVKSIAEFAVELTNSECVLTRDKDNKVIRVVDVIAIRLVKTGSSSVLVQEKAVFDNGKNQDLLRLPGTKRNYGENQFQAAYRLIERTLQIDENCVNLHTDKIRVVEELKDSDSYPGVPTLYRKRVISGEVHPEDPK